jgi:hypothetical protein
LGKSATPLEALGIAAEYACKFSQRKAKTILSRIKKISADDQISVSAYKPVI